MSVVSNLLLWIQEYILIPYGTQYDYTKIPLYLLTYAPMIISYIAMLKFFSIQVQLRAAVQNTKLIARYMETNRRIKWIYIINMGLLLVSFMVGMFITTGFVYSMAYVL